MGYYINPEDMSKEEWLAKNGALITSSLQTIPQLPARGEGEHYVCLVDNRAFTAAAICYSDDEVAAFAEPDGRVKLWYLVPDEKLLQVEPDVEGVLE